MEPLTKEQQVFAMMRITEMLQSNSRVIDNHELLCAVYYLGREDEKHEKSVGDL